MKALAVSVRRTTWLQCDIAPTVPVHVGETAQMEQQRIWMQTADFLNKDTLIVYFSDGTAACFRTLDLLGCAVDRFASDEGLAEPQLASLYKRLFDPQERSNSDLRPTS